MRLGLLVIQSIIGEKALALNDDLVYHLLFSAIDFLDRSGCVPSAIAMPRVRTITGTQQMDGRTAIGACLRRIDRFSQIPHTYTWTTPDTRTASAHRSQRALFI